MGLSRLEHSEGLPPTLTTGEAHEVCLRKASDEPDFVRRQRLHNCTLDVRQRQGRAPAIQIPAHQTIDREVNVGNRLSIRKLTAMRSSPMSKPVTPDLPLRLAYGCILARLVGLLGCSQKIARRRFAYSTRISEMRFTGLVVGDHHFIVIDLAQH